MPRRAPISSSARSLRPKWAGNSFAIAALPVIIFFASLISILYYLGIMQLIIKWVGGAIRLVTGITRVESLGSAANIFVGQSESPLVIKPYLANLTPSQLFCVMTVGMAGVAGTILGAYASMIGQHLLPYLLAASFMSAPGGILMAKIIMPDDPAARDLEPEPIDEAEHGEERPANLIMAAAQGAQTGVKLAVAVARWCSPSSLWSLWPTGCWAGSAPGSAIPSSASS